MNLVTYKKVFLFGVLSVIWSGIIYLLLALEQRHHETMMYQLAVAEARAHFEKDVLIRSWASSHGGVYVPPSEATPPNPYLATIKDRDIVTTEGKKLTLVNPAYMTRQLHELAKKRSGIQGHITSLNLTREANAPDAWEKEALQVFETGKKEVHGITTYNGQKSLRYMGVLMIEKGCLQCHPTYKIGDVRGGISVTLPMNRYDVLTSQSRQNSQNTYFWMWLCGMIGLLLSLGYMIYFIRKQLSLEQKVIKLKLKENFLDSLGEGVFGVDSQGIVTFINDEALSLTGYERSEILGKNPYESFLKPCTHPSFSDNAGILEEVLRDKVSISTKGQFCTKHGVDFLVEVRFTPLLQDDHISGAVVLFRDITQEQKEKEKLKILANTDPLTHVPNRRAFEEWLHVHHTLYQRERIESSMLMLDLDFFKKVNDTYGHQAGDDMLIFVASLVQKEVRQGDCYARIGGEEFALLLANVSPQSASQTAERIRFLIEHAQIATCEGILHVSVSIGVSAFLKEDQSIEGIISRADDALYAAKANGRNQVVIK